MRKVDEIIARHRQMKQDKIMHDKITEKGHSYLALCPLIFKNDRESINNCIFDIAEYMEKAYNNDSINDTKYSNELNLIMLNIQNNKKK